MRTRTIMMMGLAALCAGLAAMLTSLMTSLQPAPARVVQQPDPDRAREIVVAARNFAPGERINPDMLRRIEWPTEQLPPGAFSTIAQVTKANSTRFALSAISEGEPLLSSKLSRPGKRPLLLNQLEDSKSAVTISVNIVQGVAGFIQPNDRVDVLITRQAEPGDVAAAGGSSVYTDILLQNIRVLAIDQQQDRSQEAKPVGAVTLEVNQVESQKLILGSNVGTLSLALKNTVPTKPTGQTQRISLDDLPGPTGPSGGSVQGAPSVVTIIRGTESKRYGVIRDQHTAPIPAPRTVRRLDARQPASEQPREPTVKPRGESVQAHRTRQPAQPIAPRRVPPPTLARRPNQTQSWAAQTTVTRSQTSRSTDSALPSTRDPKY